MFVGVNPLLEERENEGEQFVPISQYKHCRKWVLAAHADAAAGSSFKRLYILVFDLLLFQYHCWKHVLPMAEINSAALEKKALDLD